MKKTWIYTITILYYLYGMERAEANVQAFASLGYSQHHIYIHQIQQWVGSAGKTPWTKSPSFAMNSTAAQEKMKSVVNNSAVAAKMVSQAVRKPMTKRQMILKWRSIRKTLIRRSKRKLRTAKSFLIAGMLPTLPMVSIGTKTNANKPRATNVKSKTNHGSHTICQPKLKARNMASAQ